MSLATALKRWLQARAYLRELRGRPELGFPVLFDAEYYRSRYRGPLPPLLHFVIAGAFEGADPHPLFRTSFYLRKYPDVAASGVNPLFHYLLHGAKEGRKPHPLFQPDYYSAQLPSPPHQPYLHFLSRQDSRASPHPLFSEDAKTLLDVARDGPRPATEGIQFSRGAS